jgi:hypothetical protein
MDAHTWYPATYLADGVARLSQGDVAWVSGPQLPIGRGRWSRRIALALTTPLGVGGAAFRRNLREEIEVDSGFTGLWRRDFLQEIGGWDEGWPINQDGEMAARVRAMGKRIVCVPSMAAHYIPRESLGLLAKQYWRYGQYKAKTCRRHPDAMRRSQVLPPLMVVAGLAAAMPGRHARAARLASLTYAAAVAVCADSAARRAGAGERWGIAAALATMHASWGAGFLVGCLRFGPPLRGLAKVIAVGPSRPPSGPQDRVR